MGNTGKIIVSIIIGGILGVGALVGIKYIDEREKEKWDKRRIAEKTAETKQKLKTIQEGIDKFIFKEFGYERIEKGEYRYPLDLSELYKSVDNCTTTDAWGNKLNYRTFYDCKIFVRREDRTIIYDNKNYELSSSGPDGIPCTSDDIQAWYKPNHEWDSTEILQDRYNEEIRSPLEKGLREGKGLLEDVFRR